MPRNLRYREEFYILDTANEPSETEVREGSGLFFGRHEKIGLAVVAVVLLILGIIAGRACAPAPTQANASRPAVTTRSTTLEPEAKAKVPDLTVRADDVEDEDADQVAVSENAVHVHDPALRWFIGFKNMFNNMFSLSFFSNNKTWRQEEARATPPPPAQVIVQQVPVPTPAPAPVTVPVPPVATPPVEVKPTFRNFLECRDYYVPRGKNPYAECSS